jgi:hypothetical protein
MTAWALLLVGLHGQPVLIHQPSQQVCQEQIAMVRALPRVAAAACIQVQLECCCATAGIEPGAALPTPLPHDPIIPHAHAWPWAPEFGWWDVPDSRPHDAASAQAVPAPPAWAVFAAGLLGLLAVRRIGVHAPTASARSA